jgi:hypothetical protein
MPLESRNCAKISLISRRLREVAPTSHRTSHWDHTSNTHTERETTRHVQKRGYITRKQPCKQHRQHTTKRTTLGFLRLQQMLTQPERAERALAAAGSQRERSSRVPLSPDSTRRRNTRRQAFVGGSPNRISQKQSNFHAGAWLSPHPKPCRLNPFVSARTGVAMPRLQGEAHRAARDSSPVPTPVSKVARGGNPRDSDSAEDGLQHLRSGHDVGIVCAVGLARRRQLLERGK